MGYLRGYNDAIKILTETTDSVAQAIVTEENTDRAFLMAQVDKFFSITYLLKFNAERMLDESSRTVECDGQDMMSEILDDILSQSLKGIKKNKRSDD